MFRRPDPALSSERRVAPPANPAVVAANRADYVRYRTYKAAPGADDGAGRVVAGHVAPLSDSRPKAMGARCSKT